MANRAYQTLNGVLERLRIGAPGRIIAIGSLRLNDELFGFSAAPSLPDFIPLHFYPHDYIEKVLHAELAAPLRLPLHPYHRILVGFMRISPNPDDLRDMENRPPIS
ncbi:hypothetical protein ABD76_15875 [Paenibacillus dendritiformis]|uniref:hypothetical protein n=1 Tax=Paenibacillus dendritiformis TaxID=130049 RepID=UPI0018CF3F3A|nr:hypothetical protein [Paenibacillus dendritiformis]MBG9793891.1 hypothetical protein [Paenibacillus dendritiformis]